MLYPHGKGKYAADLKELWKTLIPASGQASTVQGEIVRCIIRLGDECFRNGNVNWDDGFRRMTAYLKKILGDGTFNASVTAALRADLDLIRKAAAQEGNGAYVHEKEDAYTRVTDRVAEWCRAHPAALHRKPEPRLKR